MKVWDGRKSAMEIAESQGLYEPKPEKVEDEEPYDVTDDGERVER